MRGFLGGFVAGGGTVTVVVVLAKRSGIRRGASLEASAREASAHPALKHGVPTSERLRIFDGYVTCVDPARRTPKWVLERVRREDLEGGSGDRSRSEFFEDTELEPYLRPHLADYRGSGYDCGHLAPAMNHKSSQRRLDQTFCLSNIAPQVGAGFNRDYWARFEHFVRGLAWRADDVYVVTGPLFAPSKQRNGKVQMAHDILGSFPFHISVPTHFYKVVLTESHDDRTGKRRAAVGAFVIPNSAVPPDQPITAFAFPLTMLEAAAGVRFFPLFLTPTRRRGLDAAAMSVRKRTALQPGHQVQVPDSAALEPVLASTALAQPEGSQPDAAPSAASGSLADVSEPRKSGLSVSHLCDNVKCRLPPERFWEKGPRSRRQQRLSR